MLGGSRDDKEGYGDNLEICYRPSGFCLLLDPSCKSSGVNDIYDAPKESSLASPSC